MSHLRYVHLLPANFAVPGLEPAEVAMRDRATLTILQ